jgi:hypothetical protein
MTPQQIAHSIATTKKLEQPLTAEENVREYRCDGCGKSDTFSNPREAVFYGWTRGEGCEFCFGCSY